MIANNRKKEHRRHEHLDDAPLPIIICQGERMTVEYANHSALSLFASSSDKLLGNAISEILPDVFSDEITKEIYHGCFIKGQTTHSKGRRFIQFGQGSIKDLWFNITSQPIRDDVNVVVEVISYFVDVTDNVNNNNFFSGEHHGKLFKNAPVGIVYYRGVEFIVDFANDKALEMWGKTLEEIQGRKVDEIFPEVKTDLTISKRHAESVAKLKKGEVHIVNEVELVFTRNGVPHQGWFNYIHEPYREDDGKIIGMFAVAIEVTDQVLARNKLIVQTERELQNVIGQLQDAQRMTKLGSWEWHVNTGVIVWSDEMYRIYGYSDKFPVDFD